LQPEQIRAWKSGAPDLLTLAYGYFVPPNSTNNNGNLLSQTITLPGFTAAQNYTYDPYNRIQSAGEAAWTQTYVYDAAGNRAVLSGSWVPGGALTPQTANVDTVPFDNHNHWNGAVYDTSGNLKLDSTEVDRYDGENRLKTTPNGYTYTYDGEGRRVSKTGGGVTTTYVYDAIGRLAAEYGSTADAAGRQYLTADHLGSTRLITNSTGGVVKRYDYLPFGEQIHAGNAGRTTAMGYTESAPADAQTRRFTGKERDAETGLDYFGARYMSSAQGRFTSPDPLLASGRPGDPQSWNRYTYVRNNPLALIDPTGLDWVASGNSDNPYSWVDKCEEGATCYKSVAANVGGNLRVYGSAGDYDVFDVQGRDVNTVFGTGRIVDVSFMFNNPDAYIQDNQNVKENFLSVDGAAALFNTGSYYHSLYPNDDKLGYNGGSLGNGYGAPVHKSHALGLNLDLAYMGPNGKILRGEGASASADPSRMGNITAGLISTPGSPYKEFLSSTPDRLGGSAGRAFFYPRHGNHAHYQKRRHVQ
jgi:RHS repeat-associated protein